MPSLRLSSFVGWTFTSYISEDAPAPNAIHSFKAEISDGKIHVTAKQSDTLKANKSRLPKLHVQNTTTKGTGVVIVGGGAGALNAIESLREVRSKTGLSVFDGHHSISIEWIQQGDHCSQFRNPRTY